MIPSGCAVLIDTRQQPVVNLNLDVMGADQYLLAKRMQRIDGALSFDLKGEAHFRAKLQHLFATQAALSETKDTLEALLRHGSDSAFVVEPRVQAVVDLIQSSIGQNLSIEYLADKVNLSVPGLTKLFKKQTGVPIRRYRQWHRLYITATEIGNGKTLTEAALAAGFVDLPHCTHTFNLMLGMKPSYFLQRPDEIQVITEASADLRCG